MSAFTAASEDEMQEAMEAVRARIDWLEKELEQAAGLLALAYSQGVKDARAKETEASQAMREAAARAVETYCGAWNDEGLALASEIRALPIVTEK